MVRQVIEVTLVLIVLYLILNNREGFSSAVRSIGSVYGSSVKTLQGR